MPNASRNCSLGWPRRFVSKRPRSTAFSVKLQNDLSDEQTEELVRVLITSSVGALEIFKATLVNNLLELMEDALRYKRALDKLRSPSVAT
jgi:hypothetical protein